MIYDMRDRLIAEMDGATGAPVREYIWLDDLPVAVLDNSAAPAAPTLLYVHTDWLGRPEAMTNASKSVVWKAVYKPFGEVQSITGSASLNARFPGQWFQLEAGLHYNWWRHYDPTTGRYTQPDPLGLSQGPAAPPPVSLANAVGAQVLSSGLGAAMANLAAGVGPSLPDQGPADVSAGFGTLGSMTPLGLAGDFAAGAGGQRVMRDGASLYGYAGLSPMMRVDPKGLLSGPMTPKRPRNPVEQCEFADLLGSLRDKQNALNICYYDLGSGLTVIVKTHRPCSGQLSISGPAIQSGKPISNDNHP